MMPTNSFTTNEYKPALEERNDISLSRRLRRLKRKLLLEHVNLLQENVDPLQENQSTNNILHSNKHAIPKQLHHHCRCSNPMSITRIPSSPQPLNLRQH